MSIEELKLILYDTFEMDIWEPPANFRWKKEFASASYSRWAVNELIIYISTKLYPRTYASIDEFIMLTKAFEKRIVKYSKVRNEFKRMFSIARDISENVVDILRAMK